jgi:heme exporter protein CcmD
MSTHWLHVTASWGVVALVFGGLAVGAFLRHRAAARRLAQLDPRGEQA